MAHPGRRVSAEMTAVAAAITAVEIQPSVPSTGPIRNLPIFLRWLATYIIAIIIGTAITPLRTALQYSALMGSSPE